jgi:RHS repeat-associated protein
MADYKRLGAVTKTYGYDAFGNETGINASDANPFRYAGEYYDKETGDYYLRARNYDPVLGRMHSEDSHWNTSNMIYGDNPQKINERQDPFGFSVYTYAPNIYAAQQSANLYTYAMNNPILYQDSDGSIAILATVIIGAAAGILINGGVDMASQLLSGKRFDELDWKSIAVSAGTGAVSGALAGSGVGLAGAITANAFLSGTASMVRQTMYGGKIDWVKLGIDTGIGALAGWFGGQGAQHGVNRVYYEVNNIGTSFQSTVKVTFQNSTAALTVKKELTKALVRTGVTDVIISVKDGMLIITKDGER